MKQLLAIDTEFDEWCMPFIATSCDEKLRAKLYRLNVPREFDQLKEVCEDARIRKAFHPYTVEAYTLWKAGINVKGEFEDTMIGASLVNENFVKIGLKAIARQYLGSETLEAKELNVAKRKYKTIAKKQGIVFNYSQIPKNILEPYAIEDAVFTEKMAFYFEEPLKPFQQLYDFEKNLGRHFFEMEKLGMLIDRKFCKKQIKEYTLQIKDCDEKINRILRRADFNTKNFNPNSGKQLGFALRQCGVPLTVMTSDQEKGYYSTNAEILDMFQDHKIVQLVLLRKFCDKQKGTYFENLLYNYTTDDDHVARFMIFQVGTITGRVSMKLIQTIPRAEESKTAHAPKLARKAFIPRPGYRFMALDYKAMQMLIFFSFSNATRLLDKCRQGWDPHDATCQLLFGEVTKELRKIAKGIGFGFIFGMGVDKLIRSLKLTQLRGSEIINDYYKNIPVREFMHSTISDLYRNGSITLSFDNELMSFMREYRVPRELAYKGPNMLIQGAEAYVMKHAIVRVNNLIKKKGYDARILTTVHDELLFEVSRKEPIRYIEKKLKKEMEDHVSFKVPLLVDSKFSDHNWGDVEPWDTYRQVPNSTYR